MSKIFTITKGYSKENEILVKQSKWKRFSLGNLWILLIILVPLSGILIGVFYRNDCPLEKYIPLWEIINGFLTIVFILLIFFTKIFLKTEQSNVQHPNWFMFIIDQIKVLTILFLFAWFIRGNIWVYKSYKIVKYDKASPRNTYCNKILYLHAFWYMTTIYILLGVCLIFVLLSLIYNCINKQKE